METPTIVIERAVPDDAPGLARVYVDAWRDAYAGILSDASLLRMTHRRSTGEWSWIIRHRHDVQPVLVARAAGGEIVGMVSVGLSRGRDRPPAGAFEESSFDRPVGEVYTLYVAPQHQDRGIGRRLLAAGLEALAGRNAPRAFLWVLTDNPARFFYERAGGIRIAERVETLSGRRVGQSAYGWLDLRAAAARLAACPVR
jgi:ribosomal protein S18 acetylase RimI-like enzyme